MQHPLVRSLARVLAVLVAITMAISTFAPQADALGPKKKRNQSNHHKSHENHKSQKNQKKNSKAPKLAGMVYTNSSQDFDATWAAIVAAIEGNPNLRLVKEIDHAAAAQSVGLDLAPNRVVVFGNPNIGTPLMQANQLVGIDLPQKIQVIERNGETFVGFNDATYLAARHGLDGQANLDTIAGALRNLTAAGAGVDQPSRTKNATRFSNRDYLTTVQSNADIDTTWDRLLAAIEASPATIAFQIDHAANADNAGLELAPTRLVVFGNPNLGTPLMQDRDTVGIDLPLKILVWEDDKGQVNVTTSDTRLFKAKHKSKANASAVDGALANFIRVASEG